MGKEKYLVHILFNLISTGWVGLGPLHVKRWRRSPALFRGQDGENKNQIYGSITKSLENRSQIIAFVSTYFALTGRFKKTTNNTHASFVRKGWEHSG